MGACVRKRNSVRLTRLSAQAAAFALWSVATVAQADCYGPSWRNVVDTAVGAQFDMSADPTTDYYLAYDKFPSVATTETARPGEKIAGRCSSFSVAVMQLPGQIADPNGLLTKRQNDSLKGLRDGKLVASRDLTINGYPAREYSYTFVIDFFYTPARHRVLDVVRGDKLITFDWSWDGTDAPPADSNREFNSIKLLSTAPSEHIRSFALLQETLKKYWMYPASNDPHPGYLSEPLRARFGPTREADGKIFQSYGYPREISFLRYATGSKVMRINHDKATVDYTIRDDGTQITAISWRKVDPNAVTPGPASAVSSVPKTPSLTPANLAKIQAVQLRFRTALVTNPAQNTRFSVAHSADPCLTEYGLLGPGQTPLQAIDGGFRIDWRKATAIRFMPGKPDASAWWRNFVQVDSAGGGYWPLHPGQDQVGAMLAAGNELMTLCKGVPPAG